MAYIFIQLIGGLGNQLFQYAAGLLQQKVTNGKLFFIGVNNKHDVTDYRTVLGLEKYDTSLPPHNVSILPETSFSSWNPQDYKDSVILMPGFYQNYSVLKPILPEFRNIVVNKLKSQREIILHKYSIPLNSAFIHIRRGDYVNSTFPVLDIDFYSNAIKLLPNIQNWYIFSDDLEWTKKQDVIQQLNPIFVEETEPIMALTLMIQIHDGAIIGNSTFSWMGAYLGNNKSVVYPKFWINEPSAGKPDLFPDTWIGI